MFISDHGKRISLFCRVSKIFSYKEKKKVKGNIYVAEAVRRNSEVSSCVSVFRWVRWFPVRIFTPEWLVLLLTEIKDCKCILPRLLVR